MTEKELMGLTYIQAQIDSLERRIAELEDEDGLGAVNIDGMPHGSEPGKPVERLAVAKTALHERLQELLAEKKEKELQIQEYIESVEPYDIRCIMEMRFIFCYDWYTIAAEVEKITGKRCHRTTAYKRMKRYIEWHK